MDQQDGELKIEPAEAKRKVDAKEAIVLDVVSPSSWSQLDIAVKDALRISPGEIGERYEELPRERQIITYCT